MLQAWRSGISCVALKDRHFRKQWKVELERHLRGLAAKSADPVPQFPKLMMYEVFLKKKLRK